jgi:hypothetical protein
MRSANCLVEVSNSSTIAPILTNSRRESPVKPNPVKPNMSVSASSSQSIAVDGSFSAESVVPSIKFESAERLTIDLPSSPTTKQEKGLLAVFGDQFAGRGVTGGRLGTPHMRSAPPLSLPPLASAGVTHPLTPRAKVDNSSFTSNTWAGGTIKGTFTAAFGIWRVPTVSKPAMPPGTAGDWNSSSWVGIDGTYGSNDVLQAGIQQEVSANGDASYTPWYEWFAPKVNGSPNYIYQTNIDNMEIEPGDEVFCGIYYVAQQGEVLFGNTTRGQYFSIVLAPPPGASFSGNSAEWIVEAPNTGEPGTSLPRFSPVVFSTAFGSAAAGGSGDPANGDTTNIVRSGSFLTSVSLKTMALEIDYVGLPPAESDPFGYTFVNAEQHNLFRSADGHIHALWFNFKDGWHHEDRTVAGVPPAESDPFGYTFVNETTGLAEQHNLFRSADGHIHALWFNFTEGWHHEDRTLLLPGVPPAVGNPFGYAFVNEKTGLTEQHNLFRSADGQIHALWFNFTEGWHHEVRS